MTHIEKRIEIRKCIHCGEDKPIEQPEKGSRNICRECRNKRSNQYNTAKALANGRRPGLNGRIPYPMRTKTQTTNQYFRGLAKEIFAIKDRKQSIELMKERLERAFQNEELMRWINGHDEDKPKKQTQINKDYPNTKNMTWDEWEERGWGDDVDS